MHRRLSKLCPHGVAPTAAARLLIEAGCRWVKLLDDFGLAPVAAADGAEVIGRVYSSFTAESQRGDDPDLAAAKFIESQQEKYRLNPTIKIWEGHNEPVWGSSGDM